MPFTRILLMVQSSISMGPTSNQFLLSTYTRLCRLLYSAAAINMSHYCEVRPSPGKGKGIFAKREIPAGTRIMKEIMFFCAQNPLGHNREYDDPPTMRVSPFRIYKLYRELTAQSQKEYRGLSYTSLPDLDEVKESMKEDNGVIAQDTLPRMDFKLACKTAAIFQENALPLRNPGNPVLAVFDEMVSRINHSCVPNSQFHYSDYAYVYALKDIAAGEEIQISYASAIMERNTRRARLSQRYGFDCECPACDLDTAFGRESESRRERLCKLQNDIYALEKVEDGDDDLRKLGDMYVEMCNLLLDEGITGDERIQA